MRNALVTEEASLSVEAAVVVPVFLLFILVGYHMIASLVVFERLDQAVYETIDRFSTSERLLLYDGHEAAELRLRFFSLLTDLPGEARLTTFAVEYDEKRHRGVVEVTYRYVLPVIRYPVRRTFSYPLFQMKASDSLPEAEGDFRITRTGVKFHQPGCYHVRLSDIVISEKGARDWAYEPCSQCVGGN